MGLRNALRRHLYMPLSRAYARRFVGERPADPIMRGLVSLHFYEVHRYWPHLKRPRSFEEKVNYRMLFDRNPLWTLFSDKLRVRDYVRDRVGEKSLVPLLWSGENPEDIPFDRLPQKFVLKANHGCGYNLVVTDKARLAQAKAKQQLRRWCEENFCDDTHLGHAWGYRNVKPMVMVEAFLEENGHAAVDYKFECFSGRAEYVQMNFDRFGDPYEKFFDREFHPLDLWQGTRQYPHPVPRPPNYDEMIRVSETLAQGLDFIRVDLYSIGGRTYFGELTCYPSAGSTPFIPESYDFEWGQKWKLDLASAGGHPSGVRVA